MFSLTNPLILRWLVASVVIGVALVWILSGVVAQETDLIKPSIADVNQRGSDQVMPAVKVRGQRSLALPKARILNLNGRTEVKHIIAVQSETTGRVVYREVEDGESVVAGRALCKLEINDREDRVKSAQAAVKLNELRFESVSKLRASDYEREIALVETEANLVAAKHNLTAAQLDLRNTTIRAPVAGFVERVNANVGDYFVPGSLCATLLDLDPIYLVANVAENHVDQVELGTGISAELATGQTLEGTLSFISKQSDAISRTFRLEITVPNPDYRYRSGVTAEIKLPLKAVPSHVVSSAMLVLNDDGKLGVNTVSGNTVLFREVEIVSEDLEGLWITGLPESAVLITVGQDLVSDGDQVQVQLTSG